MIEIGKPVNKTGSLVEFFVKSDPRRVDDEVVRLIIVNGGPRRDNGDFVLYVTLDQPRAHTHWTVTTP